MDGLIAYALSKKYADSEIQKIINAGFRVQVEQDRSILSGTGEEMVLYFIPKEQFLASDNYDEYVYNNNQWEKIGTTGERGPQGPPGNDYVLTVQDKADIANIVLQELPTTQGVLYGNTSN